MSTWNGKRFSVYTSDEKSALGLIKELGEQTNHNTDEIEVFKNNENKKMTKEEYYNDIEKIRKIDDTGNFTGTWFGLKHPTLSQEGAFAQVEKNMEDINALKNIFNVFGGITLVDPNGQKWVLCVDNFGNLGTIKEEEI